MKFLLTTGEVTDKVEKYILDLFKVYLNVMPSDIPGAPSLGFDFNLRGIPRATLRDELQRRVTDLIKQIQEQFQSVTISLTSLSLVSETKATLVITVSGTESESFDIKV